MSSTLNISGLFEVHLTVNESNMYKFRLFCFMNNLKPIYAVSENMKPQLMLSKYKNSSDISKVIDKAMEIKNELEKIGVEVIRTKIESMGSNEGVPKYRNEVKYDPSIYFEWHIKFPVRTIVDYKNLKETIESFPNVFHTTSFLSFNALKKDGIETSLVTLRVSGHVGSIEAIGIKDEFMNYIKSRGHFTNDGISFEFSVYDDNVLLDIPTN